MPYTQTQTDKPSEIDIRKLQRAQAPILLRSHEQQQDRIQLMGVGEWLPQLSHIIFKLF